MDHFDNYDQSSDDIVNLLIVGWVCPCPAADCGLLVSPLLRILSSELSQFSAVNLWSTILSVCKFYFMSVNN